ncbi:hypothetical protein [Roseomonas genomospecies 6]|uniref:Uncharacterized protein n=1 Tax=Roseomonas genomospecies 6 TaxID=214106 RepID=A0A9W7TV97_9PROT|nr:hypothetical protein [Roseomonas genomospecies 6]KAA0679004.1 hypothetical protein DS843_17990 [Roseomonas genomospecies 6]
MAWLPATPVSSLPCAIASLARLERADLRFEIADRTPEEIGALAHRVEAALENACPAIGVENVLTGIEKLAARFGLELPDADVLEADILDMAGWSAEEWIAGFRGVWSSFRSGYRRFPTVGDFRAAAGQASVDGGTAALRRLAMALRQEQQIRAREIAFRRRQKEKEAETARRQQAMAVAAPMPVPALPAPVSARPEGPQGETVAAQPLPQTSHAAAGPSVAVPKFFQNSRTTKDFHTTVCNDGRPALSSKSPHLKSAYPETKRSKDRSRGRGTGAMARQGVQYSDRLVSL